MVTLKMLAQFLNWINGYCRKHDDKHEILVTPLSEKCQKGLGPSVNISTMAWNFAVKFGMKPYLRTTNSCAKN